MSTGGYAQNTHEKRIVYEGNGSLRMQNKRLMEGKLWFLPQQENILYIIKAGQFKQKKLGVKEVKNFRINAIKWDKVVVKDSAQATTYFMKKLTPKERNVQVYLHEHQRIIGDISGYLVKRNLYVFMKEWGFAYNVSSKQLYPFDKAGAELFKGCPTLANKIAEKDSTFNIIRNTSLPKQRDFFLHISEQYQNCKEQK